MPNNYFQFKEFIIHQDKSAMKVCTDACLFGAWVASKVTPEKVLDIGAGTGLLSLMIAQKSQAAIDAVEIEKNAFEQAEENFNISAWKDRLKTFHGPVQLFRGTNYDLIISNPPFFSNDLKSNDNKKNLALHSEALTLEELLNAVEKSLADNGLFAVLLPFQRLAYFEKLVEQHQFFMLEKLLMRQTPSHRPFRVCCLISRTQNKVVESEITIKGENDLYTEEFTDLIKDYYL